MVVQFSVLIVNDASSIGSWLLVTRIEESPVLVHSSVLFIQLAKVTLNIKLVNIALFARIPESPPVVHSSVVVVVCNTSIVGIKLATIILITRIAESPR